MSTSLRTTDIISGLFCMGFGAAMMTQALKIQNILDEPLHPRTLPLSLSVILMTLGLALVVRAWLYKRERIEVVWPALSGWMNILVTIAALIFFYVTLPLLGLPVAGFLFTAGLIWFYDHRPHFALPVGLGVSLLFYFVFIKALQMPYPLGILN